MHPSCLRRFALAGAAVTLALAAPVACAQDSPAAVRSPFLPSNYGVQSAAPAAATPLDALELRGVMTIGERTLVTFFDPAGNRSISGELNETLANGMKVSGLHEIDGEVSVTIEGSGRSRAVPMRKGTIVAAAAAPPPMPMAGGPSTNQQQIAIAPAPNAAAAQITQMSDQEVRERMQRVADEIRRRREMRRQMLENSPNQQAQPQPPPQR